MSDTPPPLQASSAQQPAPGHVSTNPRGGGSGKKWGIGCGIGCLVIVILAVILLVVGISVGKKAIAGFVEDRLSDEPVELATPVISQDRIDSAIQRFDSFAAAMEANEGVDPLVLDETDINALLANHPDFEFLSDSMVVSMADDQLTSEVSFNIDALDLPPFFLTETMAGKYLNGEVTLSVGMMAGRPAMFLERVSIGGNPLPAALMTELSKENVLAEVRSDPKLSQFFEKIEELTIEDNRLIVVPARSEP